MEIESATHSTPSSRRKAANAFSFVGWVAFWLQLGLALASGFVLSLAITGRNFSTEANPGIGSGIFWAVCSLVVSCVGIFLAFRYTRLAKHLNHPELEIHPKRTDALRILRLAAIAALIGMLMGLIGAGSTAAVLVAKSVSQPSGVALTDPNRTIRALDVFVLLANLNGMAAHFLGIVSALGLLSWLHANHSNQPKVSSD